MLKGASAVVEGRESTVHPLPPTTCFLPVQGIKPVTYRSQACVSNQRSISLTLTNTLSLSLTHTHTHTLSSSSSHTPNGQMHSFSAKERIGEKNRAGRLLPNIHVLWVHLSRRLKGSIHGCLFMAVSQHHQRHSLRSVSHLAGMMDRGHSTD